MQIKDGKGRGYLAEVTSKNLLETNAVTEATLGYVSRTEAKAYVAPSEVITTDGTDNVVFHITNLSSAYNIVLAQVEVSCSQNCLVSLNVGTVYSANGTVINPENLNQTSANISVASNGCFYGDDITSTGTAVSYTKGHLLANTIWREEFHDALILGLNNTFEIKINAVAGTAYVSLKFYEVEKQ